MLKRVGSKTLHTKLDLKWIGWIGTMFHVKSSILNLYFEFKVSAKDISKIPLKLVRTKWCWHLSINGEDFSLPRCHKLSYADAREVGIRHIWISLGIPSSPVTLLFLWPFKSLWTSEKAGMAPSLLRGGNEGRRSTLVGSAGLMRLRSSPKYSAQRPKLPWWSLMRVGVSCWSIHRFYGIVEITKVVKVGKTRDLMGIGSPSLIFHFLSSASSKVSSQRRAIDDSVVGSVLLLQKEVYIPGALSSNQSWWRFRL